MSTKPGRLQTAISGQVERWRRLLGHNPGEIAWKQVRVMHRLGKTREPQVDMQNSYEDRLDAGTYGDDVQCTFILQPHPRDEVCEPKVSWISERILGRLRHLALAYELPLLSRLPGIGSTAYPEVQFVSIEDELAFLFDLVSDRVLLEAIMPMQEMIGRAVHKPRGWSLVVEAS